MTDFKVGKVNVTIINGDRICNHVERKGSFEPETLQVWSEIVQKGRTAIDVGAYTGLFSISAALMGAKAIAIEPMPSLIRRLKMNAKRNEVSIEVIEAAASDADGKTEITHNSKIPFSAGASLVRKKGYRYPVNTVCLDSLNLVDVAAIKIDVEKHETAVLRGATEILRKWRPALLVEALDEDLRKAVLDALPGYRLVERLDVRNLYLTPR